MARTEVDKVPVTRSRSRRRVADEMSGEHTIVIERREVVSTLTLHPDDHSDPPLEVAFGTCAEILAGAPEDQPMRLEFSMAGMTFYAGAEGA